MLSERQGISVQAEGGGRSDHQEWLFGFGSTHGLNTSGLSYITGTGVVLGPEPEY